MPINDYDVRSSGRKFGLLEFSIIGAVIGVAVVGVLSLTGYIKDPPKQPAPKCIIEDQVTSVSDEYNGAWSGIDRTVYWKSGSKEVYSGDKKDEFYAGKKVCREWSK